MWKTYTKNLVVFSHRHFIDFSSILESKIGPKLEKQLLWATLRMIFFLSYFSLRWLGAFGKQNGPQNHSKIEKTLYFQSWNEAKSDCFFRYRFWLIRLSWTTAQYASTSRTPRTPRTPRMPRTPRTPRTPRAPRALSAFAIIQNRRAAVIPPQGAFN